MQLSDSNMPKVSFVLPAYKRRFLKESIDSILAQTCRDFELVVVDDKSPEGLYEVLQEYPWAASFDTLSDGGRKWLADGIPVRYYQNAENIGGKDLVRAWSRAMEYAVCEWCVLASDDDIYGSEFLSTMISLAQTYPQVDLVHSRVKIIDSEGTVIATSPEKPVIESAIELMYNRIVRRADQFVPEFMFRRSRLKKIGGFVNFPKAWYSDEATWGVMAANGCANCNEPHFSFRYSGVNISTSYAKVFDLVDAGWQYHGWARSFLAGLVPKDDAEHELIEGAKKCLTNRVLGLIRAEMSQTSNAEWIKVMIQSNIPFAWKLRCLKDSIRRNLNCR